MKFRLLITSCIYALALIWDSSALGEGKIELSTRPLPPRHDQCQLCHLKKSLQFMPSKHKPSQEHVGYSLSHSNTEISCNACHDANHSNYLKTSPEFPASFSNSSPVCQRCHSDEFKAWSQGIHGKRTGNWNGDRVQKQCIDCHNPHSVKFKSMKALPAPKKPPTDVDKLEGEGE
jgi:hypothetical protein